MIAVIFESWPAPGKMQTYLDMGAKLAPQLEKMGGFISIERFQSVTSPGKLLALSIWRDEAAVDAFRNWEVHRGVQSNSRKEVFNDYRLRVAAVLRDYGMNNREQAPRDSREAHRRNDRRPGHRSDTTACDSQPTQDPSFDRDAEM